MIKITEDPKERNVIQIKSVRNTRNMNRRAIMIRPTTVTIDASNTKRRATGQRILLNYAQDSRKVADGII